ncbi:MULTISPECIES: Tm-1-like ATP-binding domain-containing protein [Sporomusa]|uniref:Tm-1-like ATP-binding domain-containing protein n=1 Tax=Sporomusa TaxID=2375 RepID=UPI00202ED61F|nr:Tm-1-like ATP-binding domain-containing protein [Sporomusa sphaeroides]MCM0761585.1 Tm-1-like ATP-binding domain-containing protein [Sporomusa sphaeroides DSM 2875]HML31943.1 Tm-1-like ATP-binding domain-containing protein [Sporomusa sphaeroides]
MKTVAIAGTFDSKSLEFAYLQEIIHSLGLKTFMIHTGVFESKLAADVSNEDIARVVGADIKTIAANKDRALATDVLSRGLEKLLPQLYAAGKFDGVISCGGSGGTSLVTPGMRALPIGVPKVMVSTVAAGDVSMYVGTSDIFMYPSIVDVAGLNSISTKIFANAALAIAGMVKFEVNKVIEKKPLIAASMFGVTTPCVDQAREYLEQQGYEVLIFHATGTGGKAMEGLIKDGYIEGVFDITTTEWCDELMGGNMAAGDKRLEAAALNQIPQVVSVGALDMVNFGPISTVPGKYNGRNFYKHNPTVTLMRTTVEENRQLGLMIAEKLNMCTAKAALLLPLQGVSMIDSPGQPFYGPEEDAMLFKTLKDNITNPLVEIIEINANINDIEFSTAAAQKLIELVTEKHR